MNRLFTNLLLLMLLLMLSPQPLTAKESKTDSEILKRMFEFLDNFKSQEKGKSMQVYTKHYYETYRRNVGMWLIPSMYTIARGKRKFLSEEYSRLEIKDIDDMQFHRQVYYSTIPRNRETMSVLDDLLMPNLNGTTLYDKHLLSPFRKENSIYYKYKVSKRRGGLARIDFMPRLGDNIQLVSGTAIVVAATGRIHNVFITGQYDMLKFSTTVSQNTTKTDANGMPRYCKTDVEFKFMGNHVVSSSTTVFGCDKQLPDTTYIIGDRQLMDQLRPIPLTKQEQEVKNDTIEEKPEQPDTLLRAQEEKQSAEEAVEEQSRWEVLKDFGYDVGTYLIRSHGARNRKYNIRFSPILKPQYLSYSQSRGLSYKMDFAFEYHLNNDRGINLTPTVGYNFKLKKLFAYVPLRFVYNRRKGNYVELSWEVGNRIGNSSILDELKEELGEEPKLDSIKLDEFDNSQLSLRNYTELTPQIRLEVGIVYHQRTAVNKYQMRQYGKPTRYRSLAPSLGVHFKPWIKGPMLSINYEYAVKNAISDLEYERWEAKASQKIHLPSTRLVNLQMGAGLYTWRKTSYFLDFANFQVNNIPGGWNDTWSGDFQLLDSKLYNVSHYYISANVSYDTPLMLTSFIPFFGKYLERERLYWSGLLIQYSRPYHEMGYGFATRFFSLGLFVSFHNLEMQQFGTKFTFELFRKW